MAGETVLNERYELVAQQGSGGMSVIYKAIDRALGRAVAVKILRPSLTKDPAFLERFHNEARSAANLAHPNIVTVHDVGNDGQTYYIVMEMVEGRDLKKIVKAEGPLPVHRALDLSIQICAGIGFAHRSGLVHADVKPQNILVTRDDVVKVTDFGIAQAFSDTQPQNGKVDVVWGSPHYFAPEQARGETPTTASDVYAIGIVIFEMLTGRLPYTGTNQQELALAHIREPIPMANEINEKISIPLAQIIHKVMSKEPQARYRMADQFGHVLKSYRNQLEGERASATSSKQPSLDRSISPDSAGQDKRLMGNQAARKPQVDSTIRYSPAPNAPNPYEYGRKPSSQHQLTASPPPPVNPNAAFYSASFPINAPEEDSGLDWVTILLAILAFIAVAGLIPLFILVLQSRSG